MSFGLNQNNLPIASEYDDALRLWSSIKPLKDHLPADPRPLGQRKRSNPKTVRQTKDGSIVFTYHATDVVTWRPDNSCLIQTYPSKSTATFINALAPTGIIAANECDRLCVRGNGENRWYKTGGPRPLHVRPLSSLGGWFGLVCPPGEDQPFGTVPIHHKYVDKSKAAKLYQQHQLTRFRDFTAAAMEMGSLPALSDELAETLGGVQLLHDAADPIQRGSALKALREDNREKWMQIASRLLYQIAYNRQVSIAHMMALLRQLICVEFDAYTRETYVFVSSDRDIRAAERSLDTHLPYNL